MEWQEMVGKRVYLQVDTANGIKYYQGTINDVSFMGKNTEGVLIYFIEIIDKFNMKVGFASNSIRLIQEEK